MRINQLLALDGIRNTLDVEAVKGRIYSFPIAIIKLKDGSFSWRGEGQHLPDGATLVVIANIVFAGDDDTRDEWPLAIEPVAVDFSGSRSLGTQADWEALPFDNGDVNWTTDGRGQLCAAQFVHGR